MIGNLLSALGVVKIDYYLVAFEANAVGNPWIRLWQEVDVLIASGRYAEGIPQIKQASPVLFEPLGENN
jgi:hypothetical protein